MPGFSHGAMKKILKEPLVHFLVLGALIFLAWDWLNRDEIGAGEIFVSVTQQQHLANVFERTWQRPPTSEELESLIQEYVKEEIAYREGQAMGLADNDTVIRRRVRQKLELLADEIISLREPSEAELQAYLEANRDEFALQPELDFRHIYFSPDKRGDSLRDDASNTLALLNAGQAGDWQALGDPLSLDSQFGGATTSQIDRRFGGGFAARLQALDEGRWEGPVSSGLGLHLVFVERVNTPSRPTLDQIEQQVRNEWHAGQRISATEALYRRLAENYEVVIESATESGLTQ